MVIEAIEIDGAHLPARSCLAVPMEMHQGERGTLSCSCQLQAGRRPLEASYCLSGVVLGPKGAPSLLPFPSPSQGKLRLS